jgi:hypothetical protein
MVSIAAQIPALFETLSGMKMSELFEKIKGIRDDGANTETDKPVK